MSKPDPRGPERPDDEREESAGERIERLLAPFFSDSLLWPVTFAVGAVMATVLAAVLVAVLRHRSLPAVAALLGIVWLSAEPLRGAWARRRLGAAAGFVLLLWGLAALIAAWGMRTGFL